MPSKATNRVLTDHDEIRQWVEERGATPATVKRTGSEDDPGILRIDFPGYSGEQSLEPISWDEWFRKFDESGLALIVQDYTASGERSNFNKIVSRETAQAAEAKTKSSGRGRSRATTSGRQAAKTSGRATASAGRSTSGTRAKTSRSSSQGRTAKRKTSTGSSRTSGRATAQKSSRGRKTAASSARSQGNSKARSTSRSKGATSKKSGGTVRSISTGARRPATTRSKRGQGGGRKAA